MVWSEHDMQMIADLADRIHVRDMARASPRGPPRTSCADRRRICERFLAAPRHFPHMATRKNLSIVHGDAPVWNVFLPNDDSAGGERLLARATIGSGLFDKASIERYLRITCRTSRNGSLEI
jgi:hypothetical protein